VKLKVIIELRFASLQRRAWTQWRGKGGQVEARALWRNPWGRTSTLFAVI